MRTAAFWAPLALEGRQGAQITFDAINLNNEKQFSYVEDRNAVANLSYPGLTFLFGFRGKF